MGHRNLVILQRSNRIRGRRLFLVDVVSNEDQWQMGRFRVIHADGYRRSLRSVDAGNCDPLPSNLKERWIVVTSNTLHSRASDQHARFRLVQPAVELTECRREKISAPGPVRKTHRFDESSGSLASR